MMQCHEARTAIPKLMDGQLDPEQEFLVQHHISTCAECKAVLRAFERDEEALTGYVRRAPYAPVASSVINEIERRRSSQWWDAFRAGSYRLASVAGLILVFLVVGAGAWMLREVATGDPTTDEQPSQEVMIGTADDQASQEAQGEATSLESRLVGTDDIEMIVDRLDEAGLVFDADLTSSGDDYSINYGRVAVDRHLTLIEYEIDFLTDDTQLMIGAFGDEGGGAADFSDGAHPFQGWLAVPAVGSSTTYLELQDGRTVGDSALNTHPIRVDLAAIAELEPERSFPDIVTAANGVELCCMTIEPGVAVSTISWDWEIVDQDAVAYVDELRQPVEQPPQLDGTIEPIYPDVTVDEITLPVLQYDVGQALMLQGSGIGVLDLPDTGQLDVNFEHMLLSDGGPDAGPAFYEGPWTLSAQLEEPEVEIEPTPEPTDEPMVADEPTPEPEPTPEVADDEEDATPETLRVLTYFVRDEELGVDARQIPYTQDVATAAIEELLAGPDDEVESDVGLHTEIPAGTELLDIGLESGTLIVDLSSEFTEGGGSASILMRLAQVIHTGTQFDSVDDVQILIEGEFVETIGGEGVMVGDPLDREDFEDQAPAILIESPAPHETVSSSIRLRGTSNTFEGTLQIEIVGPSGDVIYRDYATASSGTGTRGDFDLTVPVEDDGSGIGAIRMFEHSARDGERINVVTIPVEFQ
jgi:germination protein M